MIAYGKNNIATTTHKFSSEKLAVHEVAEQQGIHENAVFFQKSRFFGRVHPLASPVLFFNFCKCMREKCALPEFPEFRGRKCRFFTFFPLVTWEKWCVHGVSKIRPLFWCFTPRWTSEKSLIFSVQNSGFFAQNSGEIFTKFRKKCKFRPLVLQIFLIDKMVILGGHLSCERAKFKNISVSPCHRFFMFFHFTFFEFLWSIVRGKEGGAP